MVSFADRGDRCFSRGASRRDAQDGPIESRRRVAIATRVTGIPMNIDAGRYYLIALTTDAAGDVSSSVSGKMISIAPPQVVLTAAFAGMPRDATAGQAFNVSIRILNQGNVTAIGALPIELAATDADGNVLQRLSVKRAIHVTAGGSETIRVSMKLMPSLSGQITLSATLSPTGAIADATSEPVTLSTPFSVLTRSAKR